MDELTRVEQTKLFLFRMSLHTIDHVVYAMSLGEKKNLRVYCLAYVRAVITNGNSSLVRDADSVNHTTDRSSASLGITLVVMLPNRKSMFTYLNVGIKQK